MEPVTVQSKQGVTLVGAGDPNASLVAQALTLAPLLVAADGGANFCTKFDLSPTWIIGDLDSLDCEVEGAQLIDVANEQDTTDFEKCLNRLDAPFVLAVGFSDARLDHTLANFAILAQKKGPPTVLLGSHDIAFAAPKDLSLSLPIGTRFSLFPFEPTRGRSQGLKWPIDGLVLDPKGRLGTSNEVTGPVELSFEKPGCIVLIPARFLPQALQALIG